MLLVSDNWRLVSAVRKVEVDLLQLRFVVTQDSASEERAKIDHIWQKASTKYDAERAALLKEVDAIADQGPFRPDWESLQKYESPEWYQDAKFGILIHWGAYSVPAFGNEWYPRNMYEPGFDAYKHHISTYGTQDKFGYKDFIPMFKAEHFDPSAWAELFKKAGAKYVVPVAEHHDGFAMYDSGVSDWTAAKMGPHRDIVGDLAKAVRAQGLHFGVSSHRVEHDFFMGVGRKIPSDVNPYREHLIRFAEDQHTGLPPHAPTPCSRELPRLQDPATSDLPETRAKISR